MSDYGVQRCHITEIVFYTKVLVNDILVGLKRILDYAGVRLERFGCTVLYCILSHFMVLKHDDDYNSGELDKVRVTSLL